MTKQGIVLFWFIEMLTQTQCERNHCKNDGQMLPI